jgi:hypothetical protein
MEGGAEDERLERFPAGPEDWPLLLNNWLILSRKEPPVDTALFWPPRVYFFAGAAQARFSTLIAMSLMLFQQGI